jgi:hypothetical protein
MDKLSRLEFLIETHRYLDRQISQIEKSRSWDDIELHDLKKQKLNLKDKIERLKNET